MSDFQTSSTFSEKMRRIRFRQTREKTRFRDEWKLVPRWLVWLVIGLFLAVQIGLLVANLGFHAMGEHGSGEVFPFPGKPLLSSLAIAGLVTLGGFFLGSFILLIGYVNKDARRRGMNATLWTILVVVLSSGWALLGFIIYFLLREPLPYDCPQCGAAVGARFNYCPNCKCNLRPTCPQCKREVGELDKFCPYCAYGLTGVHATVPAAAPVETLPDVRRIG
jgi:hypothetical protein